MAVDVVLWIILAAMIAFISCGCIITARNVKPAASAAKSAELSDTQHK